MSFAENFRNARTEAGLTQQQVADALGLDRTAVVKYETGHSTPNFNKISKICKILNLSVEDLIKTGE